MASRKGRNERSAGMVVFRYRHGKGKGRSIPEFLLLDCGKHWDYPKGHVNKGESDLEAASRELQEETGISQVELVPGFARRIVYFFRQGGRLIRKEVVFFLARTSAARIVLSDEHVGYEFLPFEQAVNRLTYANARQILREANERLQQLFC